VSGHYARDEDTIARLILQSILQYGLMCTPERLAIHPHPNTRNHLKLGLVARGEAEYTHMQSRMCFTLCEERELFEAVSRGYSSPASGKRPRLASHADLFGPFALAVEVPAARQIGILPATYYSPVDALGRRYDARDGRPGLHVQMIQKLKELRDVSVILAIIERSLGVDGAELPSEAMLKALDIELPYQPAIMAKAYQLTATQRRELFELFNTDRESALGLIGFIDMMLSLFQETDSHVEGDHTPLAFYQQREWRLIHHMRRGARWYCLGRQPDFRDSLARDRSSAIRELKRVVNDLGGVPRTEAYFKSCWVLEEVDGAPLRGYISCVVVPARQLVSTRDCLRQYGCVADVIPAEDLGYAGS
jgi:hypothetical protein